MSAALDQVRNRFGRIRGVIHAAGLPGGGLIELKSGEAAREVLAPKLQGTLTLDSLLSDSSLDFFVLCSSLSSVMGGVGQVDYCAANAFLDAFAQSRRRGHTRTISINWDAWGAVGMAADAERTLGQTQPGSTPSPRAMSPQEGIEVFRRVLSLKGCPRVLVSTSDLNGEMERMARRKLDPSSSQKDVQANHPRPGMDTAYVAPRNDSEELIAGIWQEVLGIEKVGIHDNFSDLGGHSLMATQIVGRMRRTLGVDLPLRSLFETPTVAKLALVVAAREPARSGEKSLDALLSRLEAISDAEAETELRELGS
jgi:acyl carrier protein